MKCRILNCELGFIVRTSWHRHNICKCKTSCFLLLLFVFNLFICYFLWLAQILSLGAHVSSDPACVFFPPVERFLSVLYFGEKSDKRKIILLKKKITIVFFFLIDCRMYVACMNVFLCSIFLFFKYVLQENTISVFPLQNFTIHSVTFHF